MNIDTNVYSKLFKTWSSTKLKSLRGISEETFAKAKVSGEESEVLFPAGLNENYPDRFKTWNLHNKQIHNYVRSDSKDSAGYKLPFFNQRNFEDKSYIIITEGEWDCLSWLEEGYKNVVSLSNGSASAKNSIKDHFEYLMGFDKIYINFDGDTAGDRATSDAKACLPAYKVKIIRIDIEGIKDANDLLKEGISLKPFFDNADEEKSEHVICISDIPTDLLYKATPPGFTTGFISIDEILGGIRPGELTIITGDTGSGKTSLACNIALNFINCTSRKAWITSKEMEYEKLFEKVTSMHIGFPLRGHKSDANVPQPKRDKIEQFKEEGRLFLDPEGTSITFESVLKNLDHVRYVNNAELAIIEDLGLLADTIKIGSSIEKIDHIIMALHTKAIETGMHIILIAHPTQTFDDKGFMGMANLKGSASIKQIANNVLIIQRCDRAYPENYQLKDAITVRVAKNRALGQEGIAVLRYNKYSDSYSDSSLSEKEFYDIVKPNNNKFNKKDF